MKFEIHRTTDGQFYWVLKGGNGEKMAHSEPLTSKQNAEQAIAAVRAGAASAKVVDATM